MCKFCTSCACVCSLVSGQEGVLFGINRISINGRELYNEWIWNLDGDIRDVRVVGWIIYVYGT